MNIKFKIYTIYRENEALFRKNIFEYKSFASLEDAKFELKKISNDYDDVKFLNDEKSFLTNKDCWFIKEKEVY